MKTLRCYITELLETGLTQQQLADLLGVTQGLISAIFRGAHGSRPSFEMMQKVLALYAERVAEDEK